MMCVPTQLDVFVWVSVSLAVLLSWVSDESSYSAIAPGGAVLVVLLAVKVLVDLVLSTTVSGGGVVVCSRGVGSLLLRRRGVVFRCKSGGFGWFSAL
jgi:hypothetical protein